PTPESYTLSLHDALPISIGDDDALVNYAKDIVQELRANMVRAEGDYGTDKINGKIQRAEEAKVHTMLVIGPRDMQAGAVSVRVRSEEHTSELQSRGHLVC